LSAFNCESLNSSSKSMLLNKVLLYFLPNINLIIGLIAVFSPIFILQHKTLIQ
jgi:hypothetical protein